MADEFDVFAGAMKGGGAGAPPPAHRGRKPFHKKFNRGGQGQKPNNSPLRGANGEESVNPLLNAPLPTEQKAAEPEAPANPHRNPDLPEYQLKDIQTWPAQQIVDRMMPGADPEELGSYRKHELIFAAIRSYLAKGGAVIASGCLEIVREGHGFLRSAKNNFLAYPEDVFVTQQQIRRHALRTGDIIEGPIRDPRDRDRFFCLGSVMKVNGKEPSVAARVVHFENLTATFPTRRIILETDAKEFSTRVIDLFTPIGFGQRGLIIAPPRVGKTVLLQKMANAISANHPEAILIILLIDERPEEVTDMARTVNAEVIASTFDEPAERHVKIAGIVLEKAKRMVECGHDVVIFLDSITRLARAYNTVSPASGKILSGGVDANALHKPKRFFGAARNIENGGSLTIIATALIDTGSKMDEVIFEEFKGTGNMELQLDRMLSNKRIFPAVNIVASSTRRDDLLQDKMTLDRMWVLRKYLSDMNPIEAMNELKSRIERTKDNEEFLISMNS